MKPILISLFMPLTFVFFLQENTISITWLEEEHSSGDNVKFGLLNKSEKTVYAHIGVERNSEGKWTALTDDITKQGPSKGRLGFKLEPNKERTIEWKSSETARLFPNNPEKRNIPLEGRFRFFIEYWRSSPKNRQVVYSEGFNIK